MKKGGPGDVFQIYANAIHFNPPPCCPSLSLRFRTSRNFFRIDSTELRVSIAWNLCRVSQPSDWNFSMMSKRHKRVKGKRKKKRVLTQHCRSQLLWSCWIVDKLKRFYYLVAFFNQKIKKRLAVLNLQYRKDLYLSDLFLDSPFCFLGQKFLCMMF